jgi:hypothetical protein
LATGDLLRKLYAAQLPIEEIETRHSKLEDVLLMVLRQGSIGRERLLAPLEGEEAAG